MVVQVREHFEHQPSLLGPFSCDLIELYQQNYRCNAPKIGKMS